MKFQIASLFLSFLLAATINSQSQNSDSLFIEEIGGLPITDEWPSNPSFPGGEDSLKHFLVSNLQYPSNAKDSNIEGTVYISFVVEQDGKISNVKPIKYIGFGLDEEAIRVVSMMPDWTPGYLGGKPVRTQLCIPIRYVLDNNNDSVLSELKPGAHYDYEEIIEIAPEFPGGTKVLQKFVKRHKKYPKAAKENKISGTVYISFVIDETGNISNAKILRGLGYGCDEEALRIILLMPKWIPAQTKEKPVQCYYNLAVKFGNNKSIK